MADDGEEPATSKWWYLMLAGPISLVLLAVTLVVGAVGLVVPSLADLWIWPALVLGPFITLGGAAMLIGCYLDALFLNENDADWQPSQVWWPLGIVIGNLVLVGGPIITTWYLYVRHQRLGAP